jgi:hypothetical protein
MALKELSFPLYNERDTVKGWEYMPIRKPQATGMKFTTTGISGKKLLMGLLLMGPLFLSPE